MGSLVCTVEKKEKGWGCFGRGREKEMIWVCLVAGKGEERKKIRWRGLQVRKSEIKGLFVSPQVVSHKTSFPFFAVCFVEK